MPSRSTEILESPSKSQECPADAMPNFCKELESGRTINLDPIVPLSAMNMLNGFSISDAASDKLVNGGLTTAGTAAAFGLGAAGLEGAKIGVGRMTASMLEPQLRLIGGAMKYEYMANGNIVRDIMENPAAPRMLRAGFKPALVGAAVGLAAYGAYEGYQYLKGSEK